MNDKLDFLDNPFSVTKATEFTDREIFDYWVNVNAKEGVSIDAVLNPREYLPKYIIGGKGCGKTHILRYYSFPIQKIRCENSVEKICKSEKYIGIYSVFHGINSSRFYGKNVPEEQWKSVFEYYFELYIIDNFLSTLIEISENIFLSTENENLLVTEMFKILNITSITTEINTLLDLKKYLAELRRKIDSEVLNAAFNRQLNIEEVKILFSPGDLLFGIPYIISSHLEIFKDVKFIYIFDEYEKFFEWQKQFVNTLVWDKKTPVTFWIGARRYGYTTRMTKTGQEMKSGSEFQKIDLDNVIQAEEKLFDEFAEQLYNNRLLKYYEHKGVKKDSEKLKVEFLDRFETYDEVKLILEITNRNKNREYKHIREFRRKVVEGIERKKLACNFDDSRVEELVNCIVKDTEGNPLEQKYKLFYLYRLWSSAKKDKTLLDFIVEIDTEFAKYKKNEKSKFVEIIDKRKKDLIAQLTVENNIKNTEYSGIKDFIRISQGNVRTFILILKKVIEFAKIKGEKPLEDSGFISLDSQFLALYETANWFYEDAELIGDEGRNVYEALKKLSNYLVLERFCDKPVETTISCFNIKSEELSNETLNCIEVMKMHSFLIEDESGRKEKNSGIPERKFQICKILAPKYNLPISKRGSLYLSKEIANAIFEKQGKKKFESLFKERKDELNAPEFTRTVNTNNNTNTLF